MDEITRKQAIQSTFNTVCDGYDGQSLAFFQNSAAFFTDFLQLKGRERILDVACGTGALSLSMVKRLKRTGFVFGIDFSEGMLGQARRKQVEEKIPNIEFQYMDMQRLAFHDNTFDLVVSAFGLFFLEAMDIQLQYMMSKVKPGGKLAICCFGEGAFSPWTELFQQQLAEFGVEAPAPGWQRIATRASSCALFEDCGYSVSQYDQFDAGYTLQDAEQWWDILWNAGYRMLLTQLDEQALADFRQRHLAQVQARIQNGENYLSVPVQYLMSIKG